MTGAYAQAVAGLTEPLVLVHIATYAVDGVTSITHGPINEPQRRLIEALAGPALGDTFVTAENLDAAGEAARALFVPWVGAEAGGGDG